MHVALLGAYSGWAAIEIVVIPRVIIIITPKMILD
jgi:hypothetical protein